MKGIVFTEYLQFIENKHGYEMVDQLIAQSVLSTNGIYTSVGSYEFKEMVELLTNSCKLLHQRPDQLLRAFGHHLFQVFVDSYPHFFTDTTTSFQLLTSLDNVIHPEVKKLYPDAELPRFDVESVNETVLILRYQSKRKMGHFAHGLIEACMQHFKEKGTITMSDLGENGEKIRFTIQRER